MTKQYNMICLLLLFQLLSIRYLLPLLLPQSHFSLSLQLSLNLNGSRRRDEG